MNLINIRLHEWESCGPSSEPTLSGIYLPKDSTTRGIVQHLAGKLAVTELRDGLSIETFSHVGSIRLGNIQLVIQPKISFEPLLTLFQYAYSLRHLSQITEIEVSVQKGTFQDLLIAQLTAEASELISRGLHRTYTQVHEHLESPKGKIDLQQIVRLGGTIQSTIPCRYYVRLEDCLVNQVLLAGLQLALELVADLTIKSELRHIIESMQEQVSRIKLSRNVISKLNQEANRLVNAYLPALTIIKILYDSMGATLDPITSPVKLPGFLFDMNLFFQALMGRFLSENLDGYSVQEQYSLRTMMSFVPEFNPKRRQSPEPRPDFVVLDGSRIITMLDTKYRDLWNKPLPAEMLYQLAIYALSQESDGAAIILYPTLGTEAREARIEIRNPFGRRQAQVILRPVDLTHMEHLITTLRVSSRERAAFARQLVFGL